MPPYRHLLVSLFLLLCIKTYGQKDVQFHLSDHLLSGKMVIKVKRDFNDPYLWVLTNTNEVCRVNSPTKVIDDYTNAIAPYADMQFIDIAGRGKDTMFIATNTSNIVEYRNGAIDLIDQAKGINANVTSVGIDYTGRITQNDDSHFGHVLLIRTEEGLYRYNMDAGTASLASDKIYSKIL